MRAIYLSAFLFVVTCHMLSFCARVDPDPCFGANYLALNESRRSTNFSLTGGLAGAIDDTTLPEYWYRFTSGAGGYIPTACSDYGKCGTVNSVWMDGVLPPDDSIIYKRKGCVSDGTSCCASDIEILVKNCGDFAVYKLKPVKASATAYCAGSEVKCPAGESSPTGFTPCEEIVDIPQEPKPPTIKLDETNPENSFQFECELISADPKMEHRVRWLAGKDVFWKETLPIGVSKAVVEENNLWYRNSTILGNHLTCQVSAVKSGKTVGSKWVTSPKPGYFMGLQFVNGTTGEEIKELLVNEDSKDMMPVYIKTTIPPKCNTTKFFLDKNLLGIISSCFVTVRVANPELNDFIEQVKKESKNCKGLKEEPAAVAAQVQFDNCDISMKENSWRQTLNHEILIGAIRDKVFDGAAARYIDLVVDSNYQHLWKDYVPPSLKVIADDTLEPQKAESRICYSHNDPHMRTFDGLLYHNYNEGEFVLYENLDYNFRVHVYYKKCNKARASCNCGLAAQAGNDVIILDRCRTFGDLIFGGGSHKVFRQRVLVRGQMTKGFDLQHSGAKEYKIKFPHGAEVKVVLTDYLESQFIDIDMTPSSMDFSEYGKPPKVRGLCGVFSRDERDDLLLKNGTTYTMKTIGGIPDDFSLDWKVTRGSKESLYNGNIVHTKDFTGHHACPCVKDKIAKDVMNVDRSFVQCLFGDECAAMTLTQRVITKTRLRRSTAAKHDYVQDFDDSDWSFDYDDTPFNASAVKWKNGWSEAKARTFCSDYIQGSAAVKACKGIPNLGEDKDVETCISDILLSGGAGFASSALEAVKTKCVETISTDINMWKPNPRLNSTTEDGKNKSFVMPPVEIMDEICLGDCSGSKQGTCVGGICVCNPGYLGSDCSVEESKPPKVFFIPQRGICDTTLRPCRSTPVIGDGFTDDANLTCHFETAEITEQGFRNTGEEHETEPEFESYMELHCPLPATHVRARRQAPVGTPAVGYNLTISNNGKLRSVTSVMLLVYDSRCQACNITTGTCSLKPNTCLIRGYCQLPGDRSETDACLTCDPSKSTSGWTKIDYCPTTTTESTTQDLGSAGEDTSGGLGLPVWAIAVICVTGGVILAVALLVVVRLVFLKKTRSVAPPAYEEEMQPTKEASVLFKVPQPQPRHAE